MNVDLTTENIIQIKNEITNVECKNLRKLVFEKNIFGTMVHVLVKIVNI